MKNILLTTNHPAPYIDDWCKYLIENGYNVNVIYRFHKAGYKQWKKIDCFTGIYYDQINFLKFINLYKSSDIAILGGWNNVYCFITILISFLFKTKCAVYSDHPIPNIRKNFLYYFKKMVLFQLVDFIFCATKSTSLFYQTNYCLSPHKTKFFPYSYNDKFTEEDLLINNQRASKLKLRDEKIRVFIANNFYERKGYDIVYRVLQMLDKKETRNKFSFTIAGTGELQDEMREKFSNLSIDTTILGWIEPEEYMQQMNNCDIFLHASKFEPFGIPPLDALCKAKLLISTTGVESINSLIKNGENGFVYPPSDAIALFNILLNIDKSTIYSIAQQGRATLLNNYNKAVYLQSIEDCF